MAALSSPPSDRAAIFDRGALAFTTLLVLLFTLVAEFQVSWALLPLGFFVLFLGPGYAAAALLFGRQPLPGLAINFALTVGFSVLVNVVVGTALLAFALAPLVALIGLCDSILCVAATIVQFRRPVPRGAPWSRQLATYFALPQFSTGQKVAAYSLFVAILLTFGVIGYLSTAQPTAGPDLSMVILGSDGTTSTIPSSGIVNATYTVEVQIQNNATAQAFVLTLNSTLLGANTTNRTVLPWVMPLPLAPNVTASDQFSFADGGSGSVSVEFRFAATGNYVLGFALSSATTGILVRSASISVDVT